MLGAQNGQKGRGTELQTVVGHTDGAPGGCEFDHFSIIDLPKMFRLYFVVSLKKVFVPTPERFKEQTLFPFSVLQDTL